MKRPRRHFLRLAAGIAGLAAASALCPARAQGWPTRPVTMVIPFAAGSGSDVVGRILAAHLSAVLGQQVIVEDVAGAGGMIGTSRVAKATPDGYQFLLGTTSTHAQNQSLFKHPLYDSATDFAPVALVVDVPQILIARKELPVSDLREFISYARANQSKMQYGSAGVGSGSHLACLLLNAAIKITVTHVPYRNSAQAMQDLIADQIDYFCPLSSSAIPQINSKTVKPIATLTADRLPNLPTLATLQEQGVKDFDADSWQAVFAPKETPSTIVQKLHDAFVATLETPAVRRRLNEVGADVVAPERRSQDYLQRLVLSDTAKWAAVIKAAGISAE